MCSETQPQWLDPQQPHEPDIDAAQLQALQGLFSDRPRRILDLGCGCGRMLRPLAQAGHTLTGIDMDESSLGHCRESLDEDGVDAELLHGNFTTMAWPDKPFDAVLCLGNTFMTIVEVDAAVALLDRCRAALARGGIVVLDDIAGDFWPELVEGNWQAGISEDGSAQMLWDARDSVFALRHGQAVDEQCWSFTPDDQRFRLWTAGALALACTAAGLSEPVVHPRLLVMSSRG